MTKKEEFLIEAQVYYYLNSETSIEAINLMGVEAITKMLEQKVEFDIDVETWEVAYFSKDTLKKWLSKLIKDQRDYMVGIEEFSLFNDEIKFWWYKSLVKDYEACLDDSFEDSHEHVGLWYKSYYRDSQINSILE